MSATEYVEWYGIEYSLSQDELHALEDESWRDEDPAELGDEWIEGVDWSEDVVLDDGTVAGQQARLIPESELVPF